MFEKLTLFLEKFKDGQYGEWLEDEINDGSPGHPAQEAFVNYNRTVEDFCEEIYHFADEHPEYDLRDYNQIIESAVPGFGKMPIKELDVTRLDGRTVSALLVFAVRGERFCEGLLKDLLDDGNIQRWLQRLRDIDAGK